MATPTITPAPYTSLGDFKGYEDLPSPVQTFATLAVQYTFELCRGITTQISRAVCFAQVPAASSSLMALVNTENSVWRYSAYLSTAAATYIPSISSVYSEWLGQEAVQDLVTTVAFGTTTSKPTVIAPSANTTSPEPTGNGFDRLSLVEKVFAIIGVIVGVVVPITIFLLTRRHLKKNRQATVVDRDLNGSEPAKLAKQEGGEVDEEKKRKTWRFRSPISRS